MRFLIRYPVLIYLIATLFFGSCKKSNINKIGTSFNIEVIAGNNQSDTIGQELSDTLKIRALIDNNAFAKARIKVIQPGCAYTKEELLITNNNGIASFTWHLNSGIGTQAVKLFLLDSLNNVLDSAVATASGLFFEHCWLPADCVPQNASNESFVELPDGTVLCGLGKMYTSNNGRYWQPHQTYPNQFQTYDVVSYGSHVFSLNNMNLQHSPDNGRTWITVGNLPDIKNSTLPEVTNRGRLFINTIQGVLMSADFGQSWTNISTITHGLGYASYYYDFCELSDGRIYTVNNMRELWTSADGGNTWKSSFASYNYVSIYADDNDDVYIAMAGLNQGELYRKRKNETSPALICSFPNKGSQQAEITQVSKVNNVFYFLVAGYGLMKTADFTSFQNLKASPIDTYLVTKSNTAIVAGAGLNIGQIFYNTNP